MTQKILTQARLKELLHYDPDTGDFTWIKTKTNYLGMIAGTLTPKGSTSYVFIKIAGKRYASHRLAWLYMTGNYPIHEIDHINRNGANNAFDNLRDCDRFENCKNKSKRIDNTSGVTGVMWHKTSRKWMASIKLFNKHNYIGTFDSFTDAVIARKMAEFELGFHKNHGI